MTLTDTPPATDAPVFVSPATRVGGETVEADGTRRNGRGQYLIAPQPGAKPEAYSRVTTFLKTIADERALIDWNARMVAVGLTMRPDLHAGIAAAAGGNLDDPAVKRTLNDLCEAAAEHAGSVSKRNLGTALHTFAEQVDNGQTVTIPPPFDADIAAYRHELHRLGIEIVPGMIERSVVLDRWKVAGTFDRLVTIPGYELPLIADLKTGSLGSYSWPDYSLQLAAYAHADALYDWQADTRIAMPEVDRTHGVIIHLPPGSATCTVYLVPIADAAAMIDVCAQVREHRNVSKRKGFATNLTDQAATPSPPPAGGVVAAPDPAPVQQSGSDTPNPPSGVPDPDTPTPLPVAADGERLAWLVDATLTIHRHGHLDRLLAVWPTGVPGLRDARACPTDPDGNWCPDCTTSHSTGQLDAIAAAVLHVQAEAELPFSELGGPYPGDWSAWIPADDPRIAALGEALAYLPDDLIAEVQAEATRIDAPRLSSGRATVAHYLLLNETVRLCQAIAADRVERATNALTMLPSAAATRRAADLVGVGETELWAATETQVDLLDHLADAVTAVVVDDDLNVVDGQVDTQADRYGGKRPLLAAARKLADLYGLEKPAKSGDLAYRPLLAAVVAMTDPTDLDEDNPAPAA